MTNPPANWYPDPGRRFELRYWDGSRWTEHVASAGTQSVDPIDDLVPDGQATSEVQTAQSQAKDDPQTAVPAHEKKGMLARMREERRAKDAGRDDFEALARRAAAGDEQALTALPNAVAEAADVVSRQPTGEETLGHHGGSGPACHRRRHFVRRGGAIPPSARGHPRDPRAGNARSRPATL